MLFGLLQSGDSCPKVTTSTRELSFEHGSGVDGVVKGPVAGGVQHFGEARWRAHIRGVQLFLQEQECGLSKDTIFVN